MLPVIQNINCCCCCDRKRGRGRRRRWRIITQNRWEDEDVGPDYVHAYVSYWCPYWPISRPRYFAEKIFRGAPIDVLLARAHAWQNTEYAQFQTTCQPAKKEPTPPPGWKPVRGWSSYSWAQVEIGLHPEYLGGGQLFKNPSGGGDIWQPQP